jgi:hypothetical protein
LGKKNAFGQFAKFIDWVVACSQRSE